MSEMIEKILGEATLKLQAMGWGKIIVILGSSNELKTRVTGLSSATELIGLLELSKQFELTKITGGSQVETE